MRVDNLDIYGLDLTAAAATGAVVGLQVNDAVVDGLYLAAVRLTVPTLSGGGVRLAVLSAVSGCGVWWLRCG